MKDFVGSGPNGKEVRLTSENYLLDSTLETFYLKEQIAEIEAQIKQLDESDPKRKELSVRLSNFSQRIEQTIDSGSVALDLPIPCDQPDGKCIPRFFEFFVFSKQFKEAGVLVKNSEGNAIGASDKLVDLPDFEKDLQYIRIPVDPSEKQISVQINKIDDHGNAYFSSLVLDR